MSRLARLGSPVCRLPRDKAPARWSFVRRPIPCLSARGRNRRQREPPASVAQAAACRWNCGQAASPSMPEGVPRGRVSAPSACSWTPRPTRVGSRSRRRSHEAETGAWVSASRHIAAMSVAGHDRRGGPGFTVTQEAPCVYLISSTSPPSCQVEAPTCPRRSPPRAAAPGQPAVASPGSRSSRAPAAPETVPWRSGWRRIRERPHGDRHRGGPDVHGYASGRGHRLHLYDQSDKRLHGREARTRHRHTCPRAPAARGRRAATTNWITVTSGASGNGNGSVEFSVKKNSGDARTGTLTIAGRTFTVRQDKDR